MEAFGVSFLVALSIISSCAASNVDTIVQECAADNMLFTSTEKKYLRTKPRLPGEPSLLGPPGPMASDVYLKEIRQRPFECIAERLSLNDDVSSSLQYQELSWKCQSEQSQPFCGDGSYSTFDGSCNNLYNPRFGSTLSCLQRMFSANYEGVSSHRQSMCGGKLPNPRSVSLRMNRGSSRSSQSVSQMMPFLGQFLGHDISDIPLSTINRQEIGCCSSAANTSQQHPQCAEIRVSDRYFSKMNLTCFDISRAAVCDTCSVGKRIQIDQTTSFIDLSTVYGQTEFRAHSLRANDGSGKMMVQQNLESGDLAPSRIIPHCGHIEKREYCFQAGDRRVNMHTPLMSLHVLFLREHNRIASELKAMNPLWGEEKLFQEARRINIAQFQMIVYNELVPLLVGPDLLDSHGLRVLPSGRSTYDPTVDATLFAEFSGAAYRLHTLVNRFATSQEVQGKRLFLNMSQELAPLYHDGLPDMVRGMCQAPSKTYDANVIKDLKKFLYKKPHADLGFDVVTVDIMRGRDLGLPPYADVVEGLSGGTIRVRGFQDLRPLMDPDSVSNLQDIYCDVRDIDLYVGLYHERVPADRVVGTTASKIIAIQMKQLKFGDRFYFEHQGNFNDGQLQSIRSVSLAGVLCSNAGIQKMQPRAMLLPNNQPMIPCENIPKIDLSQWRDNLN